MSRKPSQALREARREIVALEGVLDIRITQAKRAMEEAQTAWKEAQTAWKAAEEQRRRRLAIEQELEAMADLSLRTEPQIQYVERKAGHRNKDRRTGTRLLRPHRLPHR